MIFSEFYKYSFFQQIPMLSDENNKRFVCRRGNGISFYG